METSKAVPNANVIMYEVAVKKIYKFLKHRIDINDIYEVPPEDIEELAHDITSELMLSC